MVQSLLPTWECQESLCRVGVRRLDHLAPCHDHRLLSSRLLHLLDGLHYYLTGGLQGPGFQYCGPSGSWYSLGLRGMLQLDCLSN